MFLVLGRSKESNKFLVDSDIIEVMFLVGRLATNAPKSYVKIFVL